MLLVRNRLLALDLPMDQLALLLPMMGRTRIVIHMCIVYILHFHILHIHIIHMCIAYVLHTLRAV